MLCGAGISFDAPSQLPAGDRLAAELLGLVVAGPALPFPHDVVDRCRQAVEATHASSEPVRLEQLFELFSREIDPLLLVEVFRLLEDRAPNRNHLALIAACPHALYTTNQDVLLEAAVKYIRKRSARAKVPSPVHLHGRCDQPASIVTLISQYMLGLPTKLVKRFLHDLAGRPLVVLGYSGRDRDVMPVLARSHASSVLWIQKAGSLVPSPELRDLIAALGNRIILRSVADPGEWIWGQLSKAQRMRVPPPTTSAVPGEAKVPAAVRERFGEVDLTSRTLAICRLLGHINDFQSAGSGLGRLRRTRRASNRVIVAQAEYLAFQRRFSEATRLLDRVARDRSASRLEHVEALLGQVSALRNSSRFAEAGPVLKRLQRAARSLPEKQRLHYQAWAATHDAGMRRIAGDDVGALRVYSRALALMRSTGELDGQIDVLTFRSESLCRHGRYLEAETDMRSLLNDGELFARTYSHPWPHMYLGQAVGLTGRVDEAIAELGRALDLAEGAGNLQAVAWSAALLANFLTETDPAGAGVVLDRGFAARRAYGNPLRAAYARLLWERAEVARANGDLRDAGASLTAYDRWVARYEINGRRGQVDGLALRAELARDRGTAPAARLLHEASTAYARLLSAPGALRMRVAAWELEGGASARLRARCEQWSLGLELARLDGVDRRSYFPLHVV